jgi:DNA-binding transcriptional regulator YiaG
MAKGLFRRVAEKLFSSRKAPARTTTQAAQVRDRKYGGSTKDMARAFGVKERTVQRWVKGDRAPRGKDATKLETEAAAVQVTDRGRERKAKQLERQPVTGLRVRVDRAQTFQIRGSDAVRSRTVEVPLTGDEAAKLARATNEGEVREVVGDALAKYFNAGPYGGFRGSDFEFDPDAVELT